MVKVKDININERPREKAMLNSIESLATRELLAIMLRCGYKGTSVLQLAENILSEVDGLLKLYSMSFEDLIAIKGISYSKALELLAAFELAKRVSFETLRTKAEINSPKALYDYLNKKIGFKHQEHFHVLFFNVKNQIIYENTLFIGTLNTSIVHPREIFREAVLKSAASIIVSHNHPSNQCIPSQQDIMLTNMLIKAGKIMGIPLIDHILVSHNCYFSFKENKLIE